jgi:hypothetical protein
MRARLILAFALTPVAYPQTYADNLRLDHPAIHYSQGPFNDPVSHLQTQLESGKTKLDFVDGGLGYLPSLLQHLGVNVDSQALVFSKTSLQSQKISPRNPRAIYFGDDVAIGYVRGGDVMEVAALDPLQGIVFYTLSTRKTDQPRFTHREECLHCHQGAATLGVPGIFVGSVYPGSSGLPDRTGAIITDHRTPFEDRWGGWYVNALRGEQPDRANSVAPDPAEPRRLENAGRQNLPALMKEFSSNGYLAPVSDIVALMTFEHQTQMTNLITRLGWLCRMKSNAAPAIDEVVSYMLFTGEAPLKEPIQGVSSFTETFPRRGPRDSQGRSLRDFDLQTRLFRYPLSYMIYSAQFNALPDAVRAQVYQRIYQRLSPSDRRVVLEILHETKPDFPHS